MPAPRKHDQETPDRAVRTYQDRRQDFPAESNAAGPPPRGRAAGCEARDAAGLGRAGRDRRRRATGCAELGGGPIKELERENAELHRANETLKTASAFFAEAELDRGLR
jgi:transposase-like protein